jgi:putative oxidoreductase
MDPARGRGQDGGRALIALLRHRWLILACRVALGVVFVYSGWTKIADPPGFAHMVWNYKILPPALVNIVALVLPWVEVLAGAALVAGIWSRSAALILAALLTVFIAGIALNLHRGNPIDCGCFSTSSVGKTPEEMLAAMRLDILRDLGMMAMALAVLFGRLRTRESDSG